MTHAPVGIAAKDLTSSAEQTWLSQLFDPAIERAVSLLPASSRFDAAVKLNGLLSMTADNLPLLGTGRIEGLWFAEALWVTHAAGAAKGLVEMMTGASPSISGLEAVLPERFAGQEPGKLEKRALDLYRDIYSADAGEAISS
jgi:glycine/D-amino acid oxidase-like deaminating enzyme